MNIESKLKFLFDYNFKKEKYIFDNWRVYQKSKKYIDEYLKQKEKTRKILYIHAFVYNKRGTYEVWKYKAWKYKFFL
jgi:hypothetical protein